MTLIDKSNNELVASDLVNDINELFSTEAPELEYGLVSEGSFVRVTYDDESLSQQQRASINSGLSTLGVN